MAVKLTPKFKPAEFRAMMLERVARIEQAILLRLKRVGETYVANARTNGTYTDQTGNLRASIGYVILKNGEQIDLKLEGTKEAKTAAEAAIKDAIADMKTRVPAGYVLIVVAGMEYAAAVEAKGKDVITASGKIAEKQLREALAAIARKGAKLT
ncbi:hypothetical protein [Flaviaesturariibacter amylovorans]|uniref:Uncharacterized protein n=1 Tax=Flaviaesturariibacter amylovorans TaxID=1084520 RepID=A0ABP8GQL3_9BACT